MPSLAPRGVHRRWYITVLTTVVTGVGAAAIALFGSPAAAAPTTVTFSFTGTQQQFVVPADVCSISITALGGQGGADPSGLAGGLGGSATATIVVQPGSTLQVQVGGQGVAGATDAPGAGGFPDGGDALGPSNAAGGGGGGSSAVYQGGTAVGNRVVVAGGGGGSAFGFLSSKSGGAGGGATGQAGADADGKPLSGGQGGTQNGPGNGGTGNGSTDGGNGGQPKGGTGGDGLLGGAGGGGGFFGGGGGSADIGATGASGGAGGGGSGFTPNMTGLTQGVQPSNGQVTITFDPAAGGCPPTAAAVTAAFTG